MVLGVAKQLAVVEDAEVQEPKAHESEEERIIVGLLLSQRPQPLSSLSLSRSLLILSSLFCG